MRSSSAEREVVHSRPRLILFKAMNTLCGQEASLGSKARVMCAVSDVMSCHVDV